MSKASPTRLETPEDFEQAFHAWNADLFAFVHARLRCRQIAEDITQEVFLKAWHARNQFDPEKGNPRQWLYAITLNAIRAYLRPQKNRPAVELDEHLEGTEDLPENYARSEAVQQVYEEMEFLSAYDQELLLLRYMQELDLQEISAIVGKSYNSTKVALHRAVERLRKRCKKRTDFLRPKFVTIPVS